MGFKTNALISIFVGGFCLGCASHNVNNKGNYISLKDGWERYFSKIPYSYEKNSSKVVVHFNNVSYDISLNELSNFDKFCFNQYSYGIFTPLNKCSRLVPNYGSFITKKGEPSLERLVSSLTDDGDSKEIVSQKLLNFVNNEISYDFVEANSEHEIFKKSCEVLMRRRGDCSNKTILYSSLLMQKDVDHILLYIKGNSSNAKNHVAVGLIGDFSKENNLFYLFDGKEYFLADPSAKGFVIGKTFLKNPIEKKDIEFIQKPGFEIYRVLDNKPLDAYR